jgi:hypothetical protein
MRVLPNEKTRRGTAAMRKTLYLLACLALLIGPVACKKEQGSSDNNTTQTTSSPANSTTSSTPDMGVTTTVTPAPDQSTTPPEIAPGSSIPQLGTMDNGAGTNGTTTGVGGTTTGTPENPNPAPPANSSGVPNQ